MVVAGIETVWSGQVAPPPRGPVTEDFQTLPQPVELAKGEEMGRFKLGSTAILLFPKGSMTWDERYVAGSSTRLGEALGAFDIADADDQAGADLIETVGSPVLLQRVDNKAVAAGLDRERPSIWTLS